ncbi:hypothetical protein FACS1894154_08320 [Betaproteobacteria bacterium]|nr:hypothetical protein AGMMS49543_27680 [Betaproteobacteria bacterium]GHU00019.1 hypothetical protein FACS1894154_08320 [Betaproteobacteria bacterium]GHU04947.1 hypothetical protein AGMMS49960_21190 [Betaproteobacteria bacterium]GHU07644.1 hypothetical protein AGMMS50225_04900 [Betaproteobacteria bacterium]GHU22448.1 hypothetical protein AGMMS50243_22050 [Betaproteobacteria bacterium]
MATASARLEFRLTPAHKVRIERAAVLAGVPVTAFAREAAEEKAERVLREFEATTTVPSEFFDNLIATFDAPPCPNATLSEAATRLRKTVVRD